MIHIILVQKDFKTPKSRLKEMKKWKTTQGVIFMFLSDDVDTLVYANDDQDD